MAQSERIQPDIQFIRELRAAGGDSVKQCFQCASCSVACPISPRSNPYPRKEMIWAQWGLKDRLLKDPDVWLCYNCNTCSDLCPRGAKPGDLMGAVRNMAYQHITKKESTLGKWLSSPKYLPIIIAIPAIIWAAIWAFMAAINFQGNFKGSIFPIGKIQYSKIFYGDFTIDIVFMAALIFILYSLYKGSRNLIKEYRPEGTISFLGPKRPWYLCFLDVLIEIFTHKKFSECDDMSSQVRKLGHMSLFYGFAALVVTTATVSFCVWVGRIPGLTFLYIETPMPIYHPVKLLGNVGLLLTLVGLVFLTIQRVQRDKAKSQSTYYDWYLLIIIWVTVVTGGLSQFIRIMDLKVLAYTVYYLHLVSAFMLIAYLPWTKFGHFVYRTVILTYVRYIGR